MRLFDTPGADSAYDKWQNPPDIHEDDSCEMCHTAHVSGGEVAKNALEWPAQYPCCVDEFEELKATGGVCLKHPLAYFEPAGSGGVVTCAKCGSPSVKGSDVCQAHGGLTDKRPAFCEDCDDEKKKKNTGGVL